MGWLGHHGLFFLELSPKEAYRSAVSSLRVISLHSSSTVKEKNRQAMEAQLSVRAILLLSLLPLLSLLARSSSSVSQDIQIVNAERRVCFQFLPKLYHSKFSSFFELLGFRISIHFIQLRIFSCYPFSIIL